jgi:hypothetical protein
VESPTVTVGHKSSASQSGFLNEQRKHLCTDCGHSYLGADIAAGQSFERRVIGGGTIVASTSGPIRELHILPHCGTELPDDLLNEIDPAQLPDLAALVHDNCDIGTAAIYRTLVDRIITGQAEGVAVAGFHLSRLLVDANRDELEHQLPARPYVGSPELYTRYMQRNFDELRFGALAPWLDAVDEVLREMGEEGVAYHHHTYDVYSITPRPWDQASHEKRPAFQLVWERPTLPEHQAVNGTDRGLANIEDLRVIRDRIMEYLEAKIGIDDGSGDIDFPLLLPVIPFGGARRSDPADRPQHVMYDLRKDILATEETIRSWVGDGPWRLPSPTHGLESSLFAFDVAR